MRTSISFNIQPSEAKRIRTLARKRGFSTTSDYLRFLISQDDEELISTDDLVERVKMIPKLQEEGGLIEAGSLNDLIGL